jgi:hypothetical protein
MLATVILWRQSEDRHLAEGYSKRDAGIVLAGGCSSRMGRSKALLPYKDGLLHQHMSRMLREAGLGHVYLSGEVPGAEAIPDRHLHAGPAQAIADLLEKFSGIYDRLLVVPVDMPLLTADVLTHLQQQPGSSYFIRHPLPVCLRTGKSRRGSAFGARSDCRLCSPSARPARSLETCHAEFQHAGRVGGSLRVLRSHHHWHSIVIPRLRGDDCGGHAKPVIWSLARRVGKPGRSGRCRLAAVLRRWRPDYRHA